MSQKIIAKIVQGLPGPWGEDATVMNTVNGTLIYDMNIGQCHLVSGECTVDGVHIVLDFRDAVDYDAPIFGINGDSVPAALDVDDEIKPCLVFGFPLFPGAEVFGMLYHHGVFDMCIGFPVLAIHANQHKFTVARTFDRAVRRAEDVDIRTMPYEVCGRQAHGMEADLRAIDDWERFRKCLAPAVNLNI